MRRAGVVVAVIALLAACGGHGTATPRRPSASPSAGSSAGPSYSSAVSTPREDSLYPEVGDPGVDALHYGLDLSWQAPTLRGRETIDFRATGDADHVRLDLGAPLTVIGASLDGRPVAATHPGKDLVVAAAVRKDRRYTLRIVYSGTPAPYPAPTKRRDVPDLGFTVEPDGTVWTMQEPYGAFTWYAVNDQPSDKALYDVTVHAPAPSLGISNGELLSDTTTSGIRTSHWRADRPVASYLVTLAIGPYTETDEGTAHVWTLPQQGLLATQPFEQVPALLSWLTAKLGPYPFGSLGFVEVGGDSAMETQTMITLGSAKVDTEPDTLVHELAHQWWGDEVTPDDWRDLWMNEGMAMYLQSLWQDEAWQLGAGASIADLARQDAEARRRWGPPGAPRADSFAEPNVYDGPAVMWSALRQRLGDAEFWRLVSGWPAARAGRSTGRDDLIAWFSQQSGQDLRPFFTSWLMSTTPPSRR